MLNVPSLMPAEIVISPPSSVGIVLENVTPAPAKAVPAMLTTTDEINTAKSFLFIDIYPSFMKYFRLFILILLCFYCFINPLVSAAFDDPANAAEAACLLASCYDPEAAYAYSVPVCDHEEVLSFLPVLDHKVSASVSC